MTDTQSLPDYLQRDEASRHLTCTPPSRREGVPKRISMPIGAMSKCRSAPGFLSLNFYVQHQFD